MSCQYCKKKKCHCKKKKECGIHLFIQAFVECEDVVQGLVECDGRPVACAEVLLDVDLEGVTFSQNPVETDENGEFEVTIQIPDGTNEVNTTITATTTVKGRSISTSLGFIADCVTECEIVLTAAETIICNGFIEGRVFCGNEVIEGAEVTFTSTLPLANLSFDPPVQVTDREGDFFSAIEITNVPVLTPVTITATTQVGDQILSIEVETEVQCDSECELTLNVPALINCEGEITGNLSCGGLGVAGAEVFFQSFFPVEIFSPNPVVTDINGNFVEPVQVIVDPGLDLTEVLIEATTEVNAEIIRLDVVTFIECEPIVECPCKFRIGIQGNRASATATLTQNNTITNLTGFINVTAVQCFTGGPNCNPAVDNFNVAFTAGGGQTINFVQGRRVEIFCEDNNRRARVIGAATSSGNVLPPGLFEVEITLDILAGNLGTWTVLATNMLGTNFFSTFTAQLSPITSISGCGLLGSPPIGAPCPPIYTECDNKRPKPKCGCKK